MITTTGMTQEKWDKLTASERKRLASPPCPSCLAPYRGMRVEATDSYGERTRFWVGVSLGWAPCYLQIKTRYSSGGAACDPKGYTAIVVLDKNPRNP